MKNKNSFNRLTLISGVLFAIIWSLSFIATKSALYDISPLWLATIRLLLATGLVWLTKAKAVLEFLSQIPPNTFYRIVLASILAQGAYLGMSYWALAHLPTSVVNIVVSTLPLMTLPIAYLLLGERIGMTGIAAFILSIIGVIITLDGGLIAFGKLPLLFWPSLILFASVLALGFGNVLTKSLISDRTLLPLCALQFLFGAIAMMLAALFFEQNQIPNITALSMAIPELIFLAGVGSILGTFMWFNVLRSMTTNVASTFFLLTPIIGIFFGSIFFGESITYPKIIGTLLITLAILLRLKQFFLDSLRLLFTKLRDLGRKIS